MGKRVSDRNQKEREVSVKIGVSDRTWRKQAQLRNAYEQLSDIYRDEEEVVYVDCCAGPGKYGEHEGSPVIFRDIMGEAGVDVKGYLFEKDKVASNLLADVFRGSEWDIWNADYRKVLGTHVLPDAHNLRGLIYIDPNGPGDIDLELIGEFLEIQHRMDVLIHVSDTAVLRCAGSGSIDWNVTDIPGFITRYNWSVRDRVKGDKAKWAFVMGTVKETRLRFSGSIPIYGPMDMIWEILAGKPMKRSVYEAGFETDELRNAADSHG